MKKFFLPALISIFSIHLYAIPFNHDSAGLVHDSTCYFVWDPDLNQWIDSLKQVFIYDENRNLLENSCYLWIPESGVWMGCDDFGHQTREYDENGNLTEQLKYKWDQGKGDWVLSCGLRKEITYDALGRIIQEVLSNCYSDKENWIFSKKTIYVFNADGLLIEKSCYLWNNQLLEWEGDNSQFHQTWTYNQNGDITRHIYYQWNRETKDWVAFSQFEWSYDEKGKIIEKIQWRWDIKSMKWIGVMRHTWKYYSSPDITEVILYDWLPGLSIWYPSDLYISMYNESGEINAYSEYMWDYLNSEWVCYGQRCIYIYDDNGNITEKIDYHWDETLDEWIKFSCLRNFYDKSGNKTDSCVYYWDTKTESWTGKIGYDYLISTFDANGNPTEIIYYQWDTENKDWDYSWKMVEYWSEFYTDVSEKNTLKTNGCKVYPNPFTEYIYVILPESEIIRKIELIDSYGRTVRIINSFPDRPVRIDRNNLPGGIYFIRIHSDEIYVKKVIIQ
jgi:antitoxin component YwqK of YwqJK toxin-antitoxin module